ncbi:MAG: carboxynorspermidine decarboxylase [Chloroflexi bacterium]|nr:carboxynorspermidine decarboxylase [Chloroflexota bacterium]
MNSNPDQATADELAALSQVFAGAAGSIATPAFVYEDAFIISRCEHLRKIADQAGCKLLYSVKALTLPCVLELIAPHVHGFSASSLYEAVTARNILKNLPQNLPQNLYQNPYQAEGTVHITTPGLRPDEVEKISEVCDYLAFNSISQWQRHRYDLADALEVGLRVNPEVSFLDDPRYDPCRAYSKLGASTYAVKEALGHDSPSSQGISGMLIHNNCNSPDAQELLSTVQKLESELDRFLDESEWINLGGGYLFDKDSTNQDAFDEAVGTLKSRHGLEVFMEPGSAFVRDAGFLVSTVLDLIDNSGKTIAVLDTTVNHLPESFEYEWRPEMLLDVAGGKYPYIIAGSTCLAGDVFGEYAFAEPLEIGSRVVMYGVGAYNLVKAHTFNGLPLPSIYSLDASGEVTLMKRFTLEEQSERWGFDASARF